MEHQDLTDSRKDPLCISQLKISSSSLDPLPQANMAEDLTKSRRHSPIKVEGSEETWGVEDDDDLTDPIFDTIEGNGHSDPTSCFDADLSEYKKKATVIVEEYFGTNDVVSVVNELKELGMAEYRYYFVKKLVSMAMDRHDKEKEMAAFLLSTLYADVIDPPEVYRGFNKLVASADDLSVDIPDAVDVLAVFVARAIVDDILPPAFLKKQMKLLPDNSKGVEVLRKAEKSYLATPLHAEVVEKRWGGTDNWTAEDVKARINDLLKEYVMSGDKKEAFRCIKGLKVPFFHHEIVKRALIMAMERRKAQVRLLDLLKETIEVGLINSTQVTKGFSRIIDSIEDLSLDIPDARRILQSFISKAASEGWLCASSLKSLSADAGEKLLENSSANVFKDKAKSIIREYFLSGDTSEVVHCLDTELNASSSQLRAIFVKYLITLAMDRKKREKEMACVLVSTLGFPPKDVRSAFSMLIESADDTALDNPVVVEDLAMFLARAVVDEVLAPRDLEEVLNQTPEAGSSVGEKVIQMAKTLLKARLSGERILRCWGGGGIETNSPGSTVKEVKEKIQILLEEYVSGGDLREASRCVKELGMPFFHHEVVKKSVVRIIEEKENEERLWKLLKVCFDSGLVTIYQMTKGFKRVDESLEDLSLDVPDAAKKFSSCVERGKLEGFLDESFASEDSQSKKQNGSSSSSG
ncbi:Similar to apoptosis protein MA-3 gb/D50465 from Mus musculus [Arabidopsis thaliana]|uniref:MA3 DOMAIN-CONTAINING TRANSLATION REGULATORY FACTOR 2 n=3 Tax=Arabidopsis TaxID=3701 RepID=MRF2_ARATH|nr:MA3 domain-containing protein [Arabidopsis thaliana]O80548.1 RecName: Full=MA3 DOMAIN-CONTAINING TRANSLATION REGULATORY FACTOR 2; AltName: Full=MA3 domain-containing protein 8 [Arabidopsis thaliana]KAG7647251.1 Initiation factor eIF-4 gamma MA3 [Arabidopsis thaliana x Arabidopsis arenosa]AAC25511.1 Similar to apoptosis protein MA-3 gb/D50465 from Mus musculus [Arabidopsis thaliana]AAK59477.1 putative topoisomerase [Arabidopsis thaliana]AAM91754.1 putative topoisomerase [Arabidopsis thaliana|eukprot:NP_173687.1 MA3 domain-containing protein [Arabidopsis thaliana]